MKGKNIMRELELNKEYTYKEICEILGWENKGGDSKKAQIKMIESNYEFYHPINKKTKKEKKSYIFTSKTGEFTEIKHGGTRKNAGAKNVFSQQEFEYLLNCLLKEGINKNKYYQVGKLSTVYLSASKIYKDFGWSCNQYNVKCEDKFVSDTFQTIIRGTLDGKTLAKIARKYGYIKEEKKTLVLKKGIIYKESRRSKRYVPKDDLLKKYDELEKKYYEEMGYKNLKSAALDGQYGKLVKEIQSDFEIDKLYDVKKLNRIELSLDQFNAISNLNLDYELKEQYQNHFEKIILDLIEKAINNRCNDVKEYKNPLKEYQKSMLKECFIKLKKTSQYKYNDTNEIKAEEDFEIDELPDWLQKAI